MSPETIAKVKACRALRGKTVEMVCRMPEFIANLDALIQVQRKDRQAVRDSYEVLKKNPSTKGFKLPAHAIDRLWNLDAEQFSDEYLAVLDKSSSRSAAERKYIQQLAQQAYRYTVICFVVAEFPETRDELLPRHEADNNQ